MVTGKNPSVAEACTELKRWLITPAQNSWHHVTEMSFLQRWVSVLQLRNIHCDLCKHTKFLWFHISHLAPISVTHAGESKVEAGISAMGAGIVTRGKEAAGRTRGGAGALPSWQCWCLHWPGLDSSPGGHHWCVGGNPLLQCRHGGPAGLQ